MRKILIGLAIVLVIVVGAGAAGFAMMHRPDIPYAELDKKYGYPADETKLIDLGDGLAAHVRVTGDQTGKDMVLIHGYTASSHTWDALVDRLKGDYRLIAIDLPGHGLTRTPSGYKATMEGFADYIDTVMEKLGVARATVIGSSMGGHTAWQLALRHPDRVEGLVLVASAGWPVQSEDAILNSPTGQMLRNPVFGPIMRDLDATTIFTQGLKASFFDESLATKAMVERYTELSRAPGHRALILDLRLNSATRNPATPEMLASVQAPTLILHGDRDALVPVESGKRFDDAIPNSRLIVYENIGHMPQEETPDRVAGDIKDFLTVIHPEPPSGAPMTPPTR